MEDALTLPMLNTRQAVDNLCSAAPTDWRDAKGRTWRARDFDLGARRGVGVAVGNYRMALPFDPADRSTARAAYTQLRRQADARG